MRHWLFAAATLVVFSVSGARADYFVIRIILNQPEATPDSKSPKSPSGPPTKGPETGGPKTAPVALKPDDYVTAVVELKGVPQETRPTRDLPLYVIWFQHKWGKTAAGIIARNGDLVNDPLIKMEQVTSKTLKTPLAQLKDRLEAMEKGEHGPDQYLDLAFWCLEVGLPDKCREALDTIEKMGGKPSTRVTRALDAYKRIKSILDVEITKKDKAAIWKQRLHYLGLTATKHYAMVHNSEDPDRDGVMRRLAALENNFKTFYLLFALKGKALPAPTEKLTAILAADNTAFNKAKHSFAVTELISDGFHGRQENLAVFAPNRTEKAWSRFEQELRQIYQKYQLDLLKGQFPNFGPMPEDLLSKANEVRRAQIFVLVEEALKEESEIAVATHEGTRQLLAETGLLPHNTAAPEWLRFGLASLFEMPKGPFPGNSKSMLKMAFWPGAGGPNWAWRRYFDELVQDNFIPEQPTELLWETLNGYWFDHAHTLLAAPKQDGGKDPIEAAQTEIARGKCLSWALCYYLFTARFDETLAFLHDLANLPRNIELDQYLFLTTFCNAYHIDTSGLTPTNLKGNLSAYDDMARNWNQSIKRVAVPTVKLSPLETKPAELKTPPGK